MFADVDETFQLNDLFIQEVRKTRNEKIRIEYKLHMEYKHCKIMNRMQEQKKNVKRNIAYTS